MVTPTVKARSRSGTNSLDLTIPVKIIEEMNIHEGDIFTIETVGNRDDVTIKYTRVFKQK